MTRLANFDVRRILRLTLFALIATAIALNFGLAWVYVYSLTHPKCVELPQIPPVPESGSPEIGSLEIVTHDGVTLEAWYYPSYNGAAVIMMGGMT
ncbi:MAG: hypothetical protein N2D54_04250, partial [Chloroflexota bacterium]